MAFILELHTTTEQKYISNYIIALSRKFDINSDIFKHDDKIICAFDSEHEKLQECLDS